MLLGKDEILKASDLRYEEMEVPEWGGSVRIRTMTGSERDDFESAVLEVKGENVKTNTQNFRAHLLARTICDADNKLLFKPVDVNALGGKAAAVLDKLVPVAMRLNGLSRTEVDQLTKNSEAGVGDGLS